MTLENELSESGRELYHSRLITKKVKAGQAILDKGDTVSGAYIVQKGRLRVYTLSEQGREATLYNIGPGETCILAINSLFNEFLYPAWVIADEDTEIGVLPGNIFRDLFRSEAVIQDTTIKALSSTVFGLMTQLEIQHAQTVKQKLAGYLLRSASPEHVVEVTQQKIADDLGSSREFVARQMAALVQDNLVKTSRGKIEILNPRKLGKLSASEEN
ncbi:cyclic nucleotide-binding domain-containing protein [Sneathiella sp. P13V-1]|uniref:Crp/Fnr family transcriptional regulator n=1 Tax=Sneathiella sp. P13V-1 TaxID=2697366 RepID=UPI00187B7D2D|nr:Crp/Fnr family transcriptional regulator [Sneathiella sp. P13V-1]MBE7635639.1 cyclic nucleotide-binding domain-containing protein [Sneathiella sp. P13V-1]